MILINLSFTSKVCEGASNDVQTSQQTAVRIFQDVNRVKTDEKGEEKWGGITQ